MFYIYEVGSRKNVYILKEYLPGNLCWRPLFLDHKYLKLTRTIQVGKFLLYQNSEKLVNREIFLTSKLRGHSDTRTNF